MSKNIIYLWVFCIGLSSLFGAEDLTDKYRQKMGMESPRTDRTAIHTSNSIKKSEDNILADIRKIKEMRQDTFQSTRDFEVKRNSKIVELKNKTKFFARTGEKKFSFGSVKMKSYDADQEIMQLDVSWDKEVYTLFPELKKVHTAYLNIPRAQAKDLFEEKKRHYLHTEIGYRDETLIVTSMLLYDKYRFYANVKRKPVFHSVAVKKNVENNYDNSATECSYYYCNASSVNVRSKPSMQGSKQQRLKLNKRVCVTRQYGSWSYIGNKGWVLSKFLQKTRVKKAPQVKRRDSAVWRCTARSSRGAKGWVERVGKENAKRGALHQCKIYSRTNVPCKISNCYKL